MNKDSGELKRHKAKPDPKTNVQSKEEAPPNKSSSPNAANNVRTKLAGLNGEVQFFIDGGSHGNPGPVACAFIAKADDATILANKAKFLGPGTNNFAEYQGLIEALQFAVDQGIMRVKVHSDSQLLVCQMTRLYAVKNPDLKLLRHRANQLVLLR